VDGGEALGERIALRDERALEEAYRIYAPSVLAYLRRMVGSDDAEDVLQRTFLDVWTSSRRFRPGERFTSWLFTIAHHRAVDHIRRRRHDLVDVDALRDLVGEDGREHVERFADAADVRAAVDTLPDHERQVLVLAYFAGLSQAEIAERLEVPLGTVKARAARGTRRLRGAMDRSDDLVGRRTT
jgi:RNA polymerase sigma-70 factor (ECF subfamily)